MVKLTMDLIARGTSGYTKKKRDESMPQYIKRLTHLYLENRGIDDVGEDLSLCRNLIVLYLYDNHLNRVPSLHHNNSLTHLYLQNNNICTIENLGFLSRLQKLYIGGNSITVVEGLEKLHHLQELHVENQRLPVGEQLLFDPRSLRAIADSLQVINVSGNSLTSIRDLEQLFHLTQLLATDNALSDMKELAHLLANWQYLWRLDLMGNPVCQRSKYKDRIIVMGKQLVVLDGKNISDTARQFLVNWQASRDLVRKKTFEGVPRQDTFTAMTNDIGSGIRDLPPVRSATTRQSNVSGFLMPGLPRKQFDEILAKTGFPEPEQQHMRPRNGVLKSKCASGTMVRYALPVAAASPSFLQRRTLSSLSVENLVFLDHLGPSRP